MREDGSTTIIVWRVRVPESPGCVALWWYGTIVLALALELAAVVLVGGYGLCYSL